VVVLVDKALDETSFRPTAFRGLYRDLVDKVLKSSCDVWKVPHEFIMEKCFLGNYKLKEENILKRKKEIEGIIDEFYESFKEKETDKISYGKGIYDQIGEILRTPTYGNIVVSDSDYWTWEVPPPVSIQYSQPNSDAVMASAQAIAAERALALHTFAPEVNWNPEQGITDMVYEEDRGNE
jgi:hypothetical protein